VGTQGGSEDHVAILCARPNALVQYRFAPIHFERVVPVPNEYVFIVAASGVSAEKTGNALAAYNRAAQRASAALAMWRARSGSTAATLAAALAEPLNANNAFLRFLLAKDRDLAKRVTQFFVESQLVRAAGDALSRGDLRRLGTLVDTSQDNATDLLGNQVPETVFLAREARELGAIAASAFGAGFGGSVYALVRVAEAEEFAARWRDRYARKFPSRAAASEFFATRAGGPARRD
jgi:galactokinase